MQTEHIDEFLAVARYGSFRKAADALHLSQSSLSKHIAGLERELGFTLLSRDGAVRLTTGGQHFFAGVQGVMQALSECAEESRAIAAASSPVRIQCLGKEDSVLFRYVAALRTPIELLSLDEALPPLASLEADRADVLVFPFAPTALSRGIEREGLCCIPIGQADLSFVLSRDNPLLKDGGLTDEAIASSEWLIPFGNLYRWMEEQGVFDAYGMSRPHAVVQDPGVTMDSENGPVRGLGTRIMVHYRGAAHSICARYPGLIALDEVDGRPFTITESVVYRPDNPNPNVGALVSELQALAGGHTRP